MPEGTLPEPPGSAPTPVLLPVGRRTAGAAPVVVPAEPPPRPGAASAGSPRGLLPAAPGVAARTRGGAGLLLKRGAPPAPGRRPGAPPAPGAPPSPAVTGATVAVKVSAWPTCEGFADEPTVVVVGYRMASVRSPFSA